MDQVPAPNTPRRPVSSIKGSQKAALNTLGAPATAPLAPSVIPTTPLAPIAPPVTDEWIDTRATEQARRAAMARQISGRRRFVDPATCERDYSQDEIELLKAMDQYKKSSGRMFPTWCEILEVMIGLGYRKIEPIDDTNVTSQREKNGHTLG